MSASRRPRACDNCHGIKIKCELGSIGGAGPCERCVRLGKECIVTPPKRQKDRVTELEAQVKALTKLLEAQKVSHTSGVSVNGVSGDSNRVHDIPRKPRLRNKKRKLSNESSDEDSFDDESRSPPTIALDDLVSTEVQRSLLDKYITQMFPKYPVVPITGDSSYEGMRKTRPLLLQSIVYAASPGELSLEMQEEVGKLVIGLFATEALAERTKSMELVHAMQVAVFWWRAPKHQAHISGFQMVEIMTNMAESLGCGGPDGTAEIDDSIIASDARRMWNVCGLLTSSMTVHVRKANVRSWNNHAENGIYLLEYANALPTDRVLCQFARAESMCEEIASKSNFYNAIVDEISDPMVQMRIESLQNQVTDWRAQIPAEMWSKSHDFLEQAAIMYIHESVLHTPTNKNSFSAPFIAEKLSVTDFPKPAVKQEHITSIAALKTAAHRLIDLYASLDTSTAIVMPAILFAARVLYSLFILVKIYVASTATGNTLGPFIDTQTLQIEHYIEKVSKSARDIIMIDDRCGQARILQAASRMSEWLSTFNARLQERRESQPVMPEITIPAPIINGQPIGEEVFDWSQFVGDENHMSFGLNTLFPELPEPEWFSDAISFNTPVA